MTKIHINNKLKTQSRTSPNKDNYVSGDVLEAVYDAYLNNNLANLTISQKIAGAKLLNTLIEGTTTEGQSQRSCNLLVDPLKYKKYWSKYLRGPEYFLPIATAVDIFFKSKKMPRFLIPQNSVGVEPFYVESMFKDKSWNEITFEYIQEWDPFPCGDVICNFLTKEALIYYLPAFIKALAVSSITKKDFILFEENFKFKISLFIINDSKFFWSKLSKKQEILLGRILIHKSLLDYPDIEYNPFYKKWRDLFEMGAHLDV